ncbi:MAG TPA: cytochrome c [Candidatus Baltobacteraceae bacterium]|nr:cytochrome c [Candidatus Baltobacteraceae bacterium]
MRTFALMLAAAALLVPVPSGAATSERADALGALQDVHAAVGEIVRIEDGYAVGHAAYVRAAHRVLNALVGRRDDGYVRSFGDPGDGIGTLGHLDRMLDRTETYPWTPAVEGAKANVLAAAANVQDAIGEHEMEDYQADLTRALANIALVVGRDSQDGVLGGLTGALGTTALGVPDGIRVASGCATPSRAPAYGIAGGRLTYVALPRRTASTRVPADLAIDRVVVRGEDVVLYTSAARDARVCPHASTALRGRMHLDLAAATATAPSVPYTASQAHAGKAVYAQYCVQCHGVDLQGTAGPAVAGKDFLTTAKGNKWHLSDLRAIVFENMPFSNPGSLTPAQYANVLAFLLASNCYPAGARPFPTTNPPAFARIPIGPVPGTKPSNPKTGTCSVR